MQLRKPWWILEGILVATLGGLGATLEALVNVHLKVSLTETIQLKMVGIKPRALRGKAKGAAAAETSITAELPPLTLSSTPSFGGSEKTIGISLNMGDRAISFAASDPVMLMPRAQGNGACSLATFDEAPARAELLLYQAQAAGKSARAVRDEIEDHLRPQRGTQPASSDVQCQTDAVPGLPPLADVLSGKAAAAAPAGKKKKGGGCCGGGTDDVIEPRG
jgi:hypothetical protein